MKNILDKIVEQKKKEVILLKETMPLKKLEDAPYFNTPCHSLSQSLITNKASGIIAEYKRKSPSKGLININENKVDNTVKGYQKAGASAVSVLTDKLFFGAQNTDFLEARQSINIPILRKEFIIDPYQVYQSKAMGADILLLIGAILTKESSSTLSHLAHDLGMEVIYEIHDQDEISRIPEDVKMVGINNRDLKYFKVDFERSMRMYNQLPNDILKIAESGISNPETVCNLKQKGFNGFLIGESFMKTKNPGDTCATFIENSKI